MKVLITTECYEPTVNGVVTSVKNLKNELIRLGHEVRILTLSDSMFSYKKDGVVYLGSMSVDKIYPGVRFSLSRDNKYIDEVLDWKPDIVHSQSEFSTFPVARKISNKLQIPLIHTYHTVYEDYTHYFSPVEKWGKTMAALFTRTTLKHTDLVIAPTEKVYSLLKNYGVEQEIRVIPTGINLQKFRRQISPEEKNGLKDTLRIPRDNRVLLVVGRLAKEKNIEEILLFLSLMKQPDLTLLIVGDGPHMESLQKVAEQLGILDNVVFAGMVAPQNIGAYYQLGEVFVSGSNSETQGLTYIEALANGVPILCRKDDCLTDVISDGVNGWQYESFHQFRIKLRRMLASPTSEAQKKLIVSGVQRYSSTNFGKEVERLYTDALGYSKVNAPASQLAAAGWVE